MKRFEVFGQNDTFFEAVIGADQVVIGPDFPGVPKIPTEFSLAVGRHPASFEIPLPGLVFLDMSGWQPAKCLVPDVPTTQLS